MLPKNVSLVNQRKNKKKYILAFQMFFRNWGVSSDTTQFNKTTKKFIKHFLKPLV